MLDQVEANDFEISDCPFLENLDVPLLKTVGVNLNVNNNTLLKTISFPMLESIDPTLSQSGLEQAIADQDGLNFTGNFDRVLLPKLNNASVIAYVDTTSTEFSCDWFDSAEAKKIFLGNVTCEVHKPAVTTSHPHNATTTATASPTSSAVSIPSHSGLSGGAIAGIVIGAVVAVTAAVAMFWLFCTRSKRRARRNASELDASGDTGRHQLPLGGHHEKSELPAESSRLVAELPGDHRYANESRNEPGDDGE